jgi:hypothetical protein
MTSLHLLVALPALRGTLCARLRVCHATIPGRAYSKHPAGLLIIFLHSSLTNPSHCCDHQADPLIQSP